jgi:CelD/BcsL family acetyltransferase involved in cellulose biosynthesis
LDELSDDWRRLGDAGGNLFATWEWASAWWRHFGAGRPLRLTAVVEDGALVAILPLYLWRSRPLRVLRFLGHDTADELGPVGDPDAGWAGLALRLTQRGWDVFLGDHLPPWAARSAPWQRAWTSSPVLRFATRDWDEYLASRSYNFRQLVRRRSRRLAAGHDVRFRLADEGSLERDLDTLFELHRDRWGWNTTDFGREEPFHREFARAAHGRGWLRLWLLEVDGTPAAVWYGFRFREAEWFYQGGRSRRFEQASVGLVLLAHTVRQAQADGVGEYRFLRGDEPYKYRFTDDDPGLVSVAAARGPLARGIAGAAGARAPRRPSDPVS